MPLSDLSAPWSPCLCEWKSTQNGGAAQLWMTFVGKLGPEAVAALLPTN